MRIKRRTIAVPRRLFDFVSDWFSSVVSIGGVSGVGVVISGDGSGEVGVGVLSGDGSKVEGIGVTVLSGWGTGVILDGVKGTILVTFVLKDGGSSPTVKPVPVVSQ